MSKGAWMEDRRERERESERKRERECVGWVLGSVNCWVYPKLFSYNQNVNGHLSNKITGLQLYCPPGQ